MWGASSETPFSINNEDYWVVYKRDLSTTKEEKKKTKRSQLWFGSLNFLLPPENQLLVKGMWKVTNREMNRIWTEEKESYIRSNKEIWVFKPNFYEGTCPLTLPIWAKIYNSLYFLFIVNVCFHIRTYFRFFLLFFISFQIYKKT